MNAAYYAWRPLAQSLERSGDVERAADILARAAMAGALSAKVDLASLRSRQSRDDECDRLLHEVEAVVSPDDWETHFALHLAYEFDVRTLGRNERKRRAFAHLVLAAEWSDDVRLKLSVADHYREGLNHVPVDWEAAEHWYELAAAAGNAEAVAAKKRFQRKRKLASKANGDGA